MTDFALLAQDKKTMYAAYETLGIYDPETETLTTQGTFSDAGGWALVDQGMRSYTDEDGNVVTDEYWAALRWNGDAPLPDDQPGVEIVWRSDAEEPGPYPEGVVRFA